MNIEVFKYSQVFKLESGKTLRGLEIGFHTYGRLNKNRDNVVWVCHALTANSEPTIRKKEEPENIIKKKGFM